MNKGMQEILIYVVVAISSLVVLGYAVHMLVGGLVSPETEQLLITITCIVGIIAIGWMFWDVLQRRKGTK